MPELARATRPGETSTHEPEPGAAGGVDAGTRAGTSKVMSWSPGAASGDAAALVVPVGAQPPDCAPLDQLGRGGGVVDHDQHDRDAATVAHARSHVGEPVGTGSARRRPAPGRRRRRGRLRPPARRPRARAPRRSVAVGDPTRTSHPSVGASLDDPEREVVEQLVGDDHAGERHRGELVERGRRSGPSRRPVTGASSSSRTTGPSASSNGSSGEQVALLGAQPRRPLDEHVAQRGCALRRRARSTSASEPTASGAGVDDEERVRALRGRATSRRAPAPRARRTAGRPRGW